METRCVSLTQLNKTARYAIPLFFLAVKTNVDYQVVAAFLIEKEKQQKI